MMLKEEIAIKKQQLEGAQKILPELKSLYNDPEGKLKVRFYEGVEGVISAYEDTLHSNTPILAYASVEHQYAFYPGYFPEYYERRTELSIPVKCILAYSKDSFRIRNLDEEQIRKTYIVPSRFAISPEINVYGNKIAIMSLKEKFGVIIESKEVADAFSKLFELAYERAKEYDVKAGDKYDPKIEASFGKTDACKKRAS
jgi:hypothetical protein